jgi:hypothetical protein
MKKIVHVGKFDPVREWVIEQLEKPTKVGNAIAYLINSEAISEPDSLVIALAERVGMENARAGKRKTSARRKK